MTEQCIPAVAKKYSMAFFDAQNLYRHAKEAFYDGVDDRYTHPSFDPKKLHAAVASQHGCTPNLTRFYSGVPHVNDNEMWGGYWNNRVLALTRTGVNVTTRRLRYHREIINGKEIVIPQEKGVDIRIALDLVKCTIRKEYDTVFIFSQDQDLGEAVREIKDIAKQQKRYVDIYSVYPTSNQASTSRGIDGSAWIKMDKAFYDACLDLKDYRPKKFQSDKA